MKNYFKRILTLSAICCILIGCESVEIQPSSNPVIDTDSNKASGGKIKMNLSNTGAKASYFGAGHYFWSGHLMTGITNKRDAHNWIWRDLNVNVTRIVLRAGAEKTNDNGNPNNLKFSAFDFSGGNTVDQIRGVKKAKEKKKNIKVWAVVLSPPDFLKTNNSKFGKGTLRFIDYDREFNEFAEFIMAHLKHLKNEGVTVDFLSIMNEPDFANGSHEDADYDPDWTWWTYKKTIPYLNAKLKAQNIKIPIISGPETLDVGRSVTYTGKIRNAYPKAGIFATHQYGGNTASNWQKAVKAAGSKPLVMTEYHTGHGLGSNPPELSSALNLSQRMTDAFRNGVRGYLNFEWAGPGRNFTGLLFTPWNKDAVRRKNYHVYKQFTDGVLNKRVIKPSTTGINTFSSGNIVGFTSGKTAYIHVTNWNSNAQNNVRMEFGRNIKNIDIWRTSSKENRKKVWSDRNINRNNYSVNFKPQSVTTIKITW